MSPALAGGLFTTSTTWGAPRRWKSDELREIRWREQEEVEEEGGDPEQERSLEGLVSGRGVMDGIVVERGRDRVSIRGGSRQASEPQEVNPEMGGVRRGVIPE